MPSFIKCGITTTALHSELVDLEGKKNGAAQNTKLRQERVIYYTLDFCVECDLKFHVAFCLDSVCCLSVRRLKQLHVPFAAGCADSARAI